MIKTQISSTTSIITSAQDFLYELEIYQSEPSVLAGISSSGGTMLGTTVDHDYRHTHGKQSVHATSRIIHEMSKA